MEWAQNAARGKDGMHVDEIRRIQEMMGKKGGNKQQGERI